MTAATYFDVPDRRLTAFDLALIAVFLLGLYLGVSLQITSKIPLTCAPSGFAGLILLWRRRDDMQPRHLAGLLGVIALYLVWILIATDLAFLSKRFTGLVQLTSDAARVDAHRFYERLGFTGSHVGFKYAVTLP